MQMACVSSTLVASRFATYQSCAVDLRLDRAVHACGHPCRGVAVGQPCGSVHYGRCEPLQPFQLNPVSAEMPVLQMLPSPAAPGGPPAPSPGARTPKIRVNFRAKPTQPGFKPVQVTYSVSEPGSPPPKPHLPPSGAAAAAVATSRTMQVASVVPRQNGAGENHQPEIQMHSPIGASVRHRSVAAPTLPPRSPPLPLPASVTHLQIGELTPPSSPKDAAADFGPTSSSSSPPPPLDLASPTEENSSSDQLTPVPLEPAPAPAPEEESHPITDDVKAQPPEPDADAVTPTADAQSPVFNGEATQAVEESETANVVANDAEENQDMTNSSGDVEDVETEETVVITTDDADDNDKFKTYSKPKSESVISAAAPEVTEDEEDYLKMAPNSSDLGGTASDVSPSASSSTPGREAGLTATDLTTTSSSNAEFGGFDLPTTNGYPPAAHSFDIDTTAPQPIVRPPMSPRPKDTDAHNMSQIAPGAGADILPKFHHPKGGPIPSPEEVAATLTKVAQAFDALPGKLAADKEALRQVVQVMGLSFYWRQPLFAAAGGKDGKSVTKENFLLMWKNILQTCGDRASQFVKVMSKSQRPHIIQEDFVPLMQDIVDAHPGLQFLQEAPEFHSRYVHTVISRIFFEVNRSWSWKITASELRQSNFLETLDLLETEEDINAVTDYFSYEHFYVIYCKFWELDQDHDLFISKEDLARHNNFTLSERIVDRIFSGCVFRGSAQQEGRMPYTDFVWFIIAEEDKRHPRSIEYWFRCMDLDGDGCLSLYELEYFYSEQIRRMEEARIEDYLGLEDCLCAMLDLVKPREEKVIRLSDLKRCKLAHIFFDTMFNLYKFLMNEQKDPFSNLKELQEAHLSDWEKYANDMYDVLVREGEGEEQEDYNYSDDFDADEEEAAGSTVGGLLGLGVVANNSTPDERTTNNPGANTKDRLAFLESNNLWES